MRRLPEQFDPADPNEAFGAALLAKVPRLEPSPMRKRRVWVALHRPPVRRPLGRRSAAVFVGLVLCGATAASATITHFVTKWQRAAVVVAASPVMEDPPAPVVRAPSPVVPHVEATPAAPKPAAPKARAADPVELSAALMVEAMRARRAGNFARVRDLSSEYRLKYPSGALHEEALALSIEAAAALGDTDASRLAALYLQRYPSGRFRAQAQRALGSSR